MRNIRHLFRIARVIRRYGLDEVLAKVDSLKRFTFLFKLLPVDRKDVEDLPRGQRFRLALEELGPVFVKFGQALSTRPDMLPPDIAKELTKLQDQVPPFDAKQSVALIEKAYGEPVSERFASFDPEPIASASVAQVHYATLKTGEDIIIKVIRPDILPVIERDIALLYKLAELANRFWAEAGRLHLDEIVHDYDNTIHDELDLMREAANASQLRVNFLNSDLIYVPQVYWDHCQTNVMAMERIDGIPIRDVDAIVEAGIDLKKLGHAGVEIFFTQAFRDGFFHADMHPGNIFVGKNGQYRAVDFGIMGSLSDSDKRYLAENLLAFFNRDYKMVADSHIRAGWVPADTRATDFEAAIRTVCEPIFARPIKEISFGKFLMSLFRTAQRFNMPLQPQLVLLQKTLLNIEGLGRTLYPDLDLWETAKPFLERWMRDQIGPKAAIRTIKQEMPKLFTMMPELPGMTHELMRRVRDEQLTLNTQSEQIEKLQIQLAKNALRQNSLLLGAILLAAGWFISNAEASNSELLSTLFYTASALSILVGWFKSRNI
ncbi:MAG: ubiquinone biosynthesis regulatory protein kinase UbiB [Methylococcales bacterium]|nr:ubiquinone biosynthesis regulatory protein kinase UbiB [Methylococcales bacterium]